MLFSFLFYNRTVFSSNTQRSLPEASYNSFVLLLLLLISNQLWLLSILPKNVLYSFFTEMPLQYYNRLGLGLDISLSRQIVLPQIVRILILKTLQITQEIWMVRRRGSEQRAA